MMLRLALLAALAAGPALAETLVPTRTIRSTEIIAAGDLEILATAVPGALSSPRQAVGMEARVTLYPGRPIQPGHIGPAAVVDRNQIVPLIYQNGGLRIVTDGRAMARGGVGDAVRVMNMSSRKTVTGRVATDGTVIVEGAGLGF